MAYPRFLKALAEKTPVLGQIVAERDRLRRAVAQIESTQNSSYCHCCRQNTQFEIHGEWLRDEYFCSTCSSIPRQRHVQHILDTYFKGWEKLDIHESSPSNNFISKYCESYSSSQHFEGVETGTTVDGVRCENLECLTFPDNSLDLFITQDVFEHVFNPHLAAAEIMRVLKPGGAHVFTAPKHKGIASSYPRARLEAGQTNYIFDAVYHGNPIGDGRALVTWDYGDDFEELIYKWSNHHTSTYITRDTRLGLDGEYLEVFVTRKSVG